MIAPLTNSRVFLAAALEYAADGVPVFPIHGLVPTRDGPRCTCGIDCGRNAGKHPRVSGGFKAASTDRDQITEWWTKWPDANIGLATGDAANIVVIDIDGDKGRASLAKLLAVAGIAEMPPTYTVTTGSGGAHYYFFGSRGITNRAFGPEYPGVDVRGNGGYVVAPPSRHRSGGVYALTSPVAPIPLPDYLRPQAAPAAPLEDVGETTCERAENALDRATAKLTNMPPAIEGQNGSGACFIAAVEAFRFGLTSAEVFDLLETHYNPRCLPPWSAEELAHKVEDARRTSSIARDSVANSDTIGRAVARAKAAAPKEPETEEDYGAEDFAYMCHMDKFVVRTGGRWRTDAFYGREGIAHWLCRRGIRLDDARVVIKAGEYKLAHGFGYAVDDGSTIQQGRDLLLNLYTRPEIVAEAGACPSIDRILSMLTDGDAAGVAWLKNWIAALVQRPTVRGQVAPVLYSKHTGTGKTTLGKIIRTVVGLPNCTEIGQAQLTGSFNSLFATSLFVVANEVFNSDKQQDQSNRMKALITDETINVNTKGIPEYRVPNRITWLITSNSKTPVRLEGDTDRRYAIFNSGEPDADYREFLAALFGDEREFTPEAMREIAAFAHELQAMAVDWKKAATPYASAARAALAESTQSAEDAFLDECEAVGPAHVVDTYRPESWNGMAQAKDTWDFGDEGVAQVALSGAFQTYCKQHGRHVVSTQRLTLAARERGVKVTRYGRGKRPWIYTNWAAPELQIELKAVPSLVGHGGYSAAPKDGFAFDKLRHLTSSAFSGNLGPGGNRP